ncbi:MAG: hypothetical protein EXS55_02360 [Candidatus Magasanikbacteria bacterium]|nr:hypothetical protein [Candidatus Magasanikbacteria bacterium]
MGSATQIKNPLTELFLHCLPRATERALLACSKLSLFSERGWYLAGGTALTLQVGHRQSVDLDFFTTNKNFDEVRIERALFNTGQWVTTYRQAGTIYGTFLKAKVSLIAYPFFKPTRRRLAYGNVKMLTPADIAVMKILAISQRGRKRDFIDLYWYCRSRESLREVVRRALQQFSGQENNVSHILKSLTYFADAENDVAPKLFFKISWSEVKKFFEREVITLGHGMLMSY